MERSGGSEVERSGCSKREGKRKKDASNEGQFLKSVSHTLFFGGGKGTHEVSSLQQ